MSNNLEFLAQQLQANPLECEAFGISIASLEAAIQTRSHLLQQLYPVLQTLCREQFHWQDVPLELCWRVWLPLGMLLAEWRQQLGRPLIHGLLGVQGTGKTTLTAILSLILHHLGYRVCCLSLDDLYKTYRDRQLLQQIDPRLRWRGPPGTHDVELGIALLQQFRKGRFPVQVPRFDKSACGGAGDRTSPETILAADILLFEGWFVGVRPIDNPTFDPAPPPIGTESDRAFARDCNTRLQSYLPLWDLLDRLTVLYPTDYRLSQQWRLQAEQQMMAAGRTGMTDQEVIQFVEYFWRSLHPALFFPPLLNDVHHVDLVIEINPDRTPGAMYRPQKS